MQVVLKNKDHPNVLKYGVLCSHLSNNIIVQISFLSLLCFTPVENTRKVAKNLDYGNKQASAELLKSHVDVLVPEVIQVQFSNKVEVE